MKLVLVCLVLALPVVGVAQEFKDVPKDHWAAESVNKLASEGIIKGYPDGTFKGNENVTRYELAVALERMVSFIQNSRQPLADDGSKSSQKPVAAAEAKSLQAGGFIPADSPLLTDTTKPITADQLSDALASVAKRLIELEHPEKPEAK